MRSGGERRRSAGARRTRGSGSAAPAVAGGVAGVLPQGQREAAEAEVVRQPGMPGQAPGEGVGVGVGGEQGLEPRARRASA